MVKRPLLVGDSLRVPALSSDASGVVLLKRVLKEVAAKLPLTHPKTGALGRYIPPSATPLIVPTQYIAQIHSILVQQVFFTFHLVSRDAGTEAVACPALHDPRSLLEGCRVD
ncbi:hypothetical protein AVEN_199915-1 [Araneus ventricosus]|uniref:Uncharacterized protein n=1 Tax=Araneus ventricosus TaxID=182803 RepID=A0A4Y2N5R5_ARAVE|nr:hypothetical protein AVEN_199915-1 [Araneus ventricosus]